MESPYPVLYSFRRCPYAMRARLALAACGQVYELREVILARKPAELLKVSPKATVPVMILPAGDVIDQSLDIMHWALLQHDPQQWLPANDAAFEESSEWISRCDGPFKRQLDRYKYPQRHGLADGLENRAQAAGYLHRINEQLARQPALAGVKPGLADMAVAPFVRQFAHVDPIWFESQDWQPLKIWLHHFENSPLLARVMTKYPAWEPGQTPVYQE